MWEYTLFLELLVLRIFFYSSCIHGYYLAEWIPKLDTNYPLLAEKEMVIILSIHNIFEIITQNRVVTLYIRQLAQQLPF